MGRPERLVLLVLLVGACSHREPAADLTHIEPAAGPVATALAPMRLVADDDRACAAIVAEALASGDARGLPLEIAVVGEDVRQLAVDLPIGIVDASGVGAERCAILVDLPPIVVAGERRELGREKVASSYRAGTRARKNPEHAQAEKELAALDAQELEMPKLKASGDMLFDLLGLAAGGLARGVDWALSSHERAAAEARVAATPATIEAAIDRDYEVEVHEVEVSRRYSVRLALVDQTRGTVVEGSRAVLETHRFRVAPRLHEDDLELRDLGVVLPADAAAWEASPPSVGTRTMLEWMAAELALQEAVAGRAQDVLLAWQAAPPAPQALDPVAPATVVDAEATFPQSIVTVFGMGGEGQGVYVAIDKVATVRPLLGPSSLARVELPDGLTTYGVLIAELPGAEAVLLHMPRDGQPIPLTSGGAAPALVPDGLPGSPVFAAGRLVGLRTGAAGGGLVEAAKITRLLEDLGEESAALRTPVRPSLR